MDAAIFLNAFVSLFVIANPLAVASIFVALMAQCAPAEARSTAIKAVAVASGVLFFFAFLGEDLLTSLGIRLPSFRIAGGILLFSIAFKMVFSDSPFSAARSEKVALSERADVAVFPLAIPLIAGPGCMTAMILLTSGARRSEALPSVLLALVLVMGATLAILLAARSLMRLLGSSGNVIIARVMGVLLAARSVQFIVDGVRDAIALALSAAV